MVSLPSSAIVLRKHQFTGEHTPLTSIVKAQATQVHHHCRPGVYVTHTQRLTGGLAAKQEGSYSPAQLIFLGLLCKRTLSALLWNHVLTLRKTALFGEVMVNINDKKESAELAFKYMLCLVLAPTTFTDRDKRGTSCKMRCGMTNVFRMWQQQQQHFVVWSKGLISPQRALSASSLITPPSNCCRSKEKRRAYSQS